MNQQPHKIAFCITCKGRVHHLKRTLPQNLIDNADYQNLKFVILNYNSQDGLMEYLETEHAEAIACGRIVVYTAKDVTNFRMAHAKNMAHRLGMLEGADILVNLDADNLTNPGFATYINEQFHYHGSNAFLWACMIKGVLTRGISGRIVVTKDQFLNVGGYDEKFETWSPDDKDFNQRLQCAGFIPYEIDPKYLGGIKHDDRLRFKEYPHVRYLITESEYDDCDPHKCHTRIVNYGKVGMGFVTRNFDCELIELGPIPTRVFGIGMHKTGTASLDKAFRLLGFKSAHWKTAGWARKVWMEIKECGQSPIMERYYALSDLPIPLLYKDLDKGYPGSKFILTIRNELDWLRSVGKHWDHKHNPRRLNWKNEPFTQRVHQELYGRKTFDPEIFLARYRKHNEEVIEYFKDRTNDLLILDLEYQIDWEELCKFLDQPIPESEYPRVNVTPCAPIDLEIGLWSWLRQKLCSLVHWIFE